MIAFGNAVGDRGGDGVVRVVDVDEVDDDDQDEDE